MGFEEGRPGPVTRSILWLQLAVQLIVIGAGLTLAGSYVADLRTTAPDTTDFVWFAAVAALAAAIAAILLRCLRWSAERSGPRDRRIRTAVVGAVSFAILSAALGAAAVAADRAGLGCEYYRFDREAWDANGATGPFNEDRHDRSAIGEGLAECERLTGLTDREVRHLLGGPALTGSGSRSYSLGDPISWSRRTLAVRYGPDGRVTAAGVETRQID